MPIYYLLHWEKMSNYGGHTSYVLLMLVSILSLWFWYWLPVWHLLCWAEKIELPFLTYGVCISHQHKHVFFLDDWRAHQPTVLNILNGGCCDNCWFESQEMFWINTPVYLSMNLNGNIFAYVASFCCYILIFFICICPKFIFFYESFQNYNLIPMFFSLPIFRFKIFG